MNGFPTFKSIRKVYLQKYHFAHERKGVRDKQTLDEIVETSLKQAGLWDQVKDDLHKSAFTSQVVSSNVFVLQAIAVKPQILLMDEPAASLNL